MVVRQKQTLKMRRRMREKHEVKVGEYSGEMGGQELNERLHSFVSLTYITTRMRTDTVTTAWIKNIALDGTENRDSKSKKA